MRLQDRVLIELASQPTIIPYYDVTIYGGEYQDTLQLDDTLLPDNASALRNLASDSTHRRWCVHSMIKFNRRKNV